MITKPTIIITSLGRTGTKFFAKVFDTAIPDGTTLHQPDIIGRSKPILKQFQDSGFINLTIRRTFGNWSLIKLSDQRIKGSISSEQAAKELYRQRASFIASKPGAAYIESSSGYYGLLDVVGKVFQNYKLIYIIRDGRDWVTSQYNWGGLYSQDLILGKLKHLLGHKWLTAADFPNDPLADNWHNLSRFEKICWAWAKLNHKAIGHSQSDKYIKLIKFEDIFKSDCGHQNLINLTQFAVNLPQPISINLDDISGILKKPENKSLGNFPDWHHWSSKQKSFFEQICGPMMKEADYKT